MKSKLKRTTRTEAVVIFIAKILSARFPVPMAEFRDVDVWGDERTFRRLRQEVNHQWLLQTGRPLFKIVGTRPERSLLRVEDAHGPSRN